MRILRKLGGNPMHKVNPKMSCWEDNPSNQTKVIFADEP